MKTLTDLARELREHAILMSRPGTASHRQISEAADRLEAIELVLKPFADLAEVFDTPGGTRPSEGEIHVWSKLVDGKPKDYALTVEMLRAARAMISAAPPAPSVDEEMLEALEEIESETRLFQHGDDNLRAWIRGISKRARAAISKATGGKE